SMRMTTGRETFHKGDVIFTEAQDSQRVCLVCDGCLEAMRQGQHLGFIRAGEFVGEMGVLASLPRNASVTVVTQNATVEWMNREEFLSLIRNDFKSAVTLMYALSQRTRSLI